MFHRGVTELALVSLLLGGIRVVWPSSTPSPIHAAHCESGETEDQFTCLRPKRIDQIDQFELEIIPGMTRNLAEEILRRRNEIRLAVQREPRSKYHALEVISGIGKKRGSLFGSWLLLN